MLEMTTEAADAFLVANRQAEIDAARKRFVPGTPVRNRVKEGRRGYVARMFSPGPVWGVAAIAAVVGDLEIVFSPGHSTVSNRYDDWEIIPEPERTMVEKVRYEILTHVEPKVGPDGAEVEDEQLPWKLLYLLCEGDKSIDDVLPMDYFPYTLTELAMNLAYVHDKHNSLREEST